MAISIAKTKIVAAYPVRWDQTAMLWEVLVSGTWLFFNSHINTQRMAEHASAQLFTANKAGN